jgi:outer membrane translocation and assembly module TamA
MYGSGNDLRGYEMGRYRDRASWAAQVELRQHLFGKFGAVAFAGVGGTAPDLGNLDDSKFLPATGFGLRYMANKATGINLRLDYAVGKDTDAFYFSIGEAF